MMALAYLDTMHLVASDLPSEGIHKDGLTKANRPAVCSWSPIFAGQETKT